MTAGGATTSTDRRAAVAVLAAPGQVEVRSETVRRPDDHEVVVRLEGCGVCASNLEPWRGRPWFDYPFAPGSPGHEGWGVVEEVGSAVVDLQPGSRVATFADGAYAAIQVAAAETVVPLPPELDGRAFPGEPLGCAMNIFERSRISTGDRVAVVGVGFLGALLVQLATAAGARVVGISRRPWALEVARRAGAEEVASAEEPEASLAQVERWTEGVLCDVVVEATGKQAPLDLAARLTRIRGRLVVAGYHQDGSRQVDMRLWNWRGLDVINAHEREPARYVEGIRRAVEATLDGRIRPASLLTHTFPLEELGTALQHAEERPPGFLKALVVP